MNSDMIGGVLRAVIPAVIAYLVGAGTIPDGDYTEAIAAVVTLAATVWSIISNRTGKVIGTPK